MRKKLKLSDFHTYQKAALSHLLNNPKCGLILDMGLGKTVTTLTGLKMLQLTGEIRRPLLVAPKLVTEQTWIAELKKWEHLTGLKISRIIGTESERLAALKVKADIYAVSRDNITWLVEHYKRKWPFDALVIDESSSFKNRASKRFKSVQKVLGFFSRVILLTGTPAPNGLMDMWSQMYLLDKGERLGKTIGGYRQRYFQRIFKDGFISSYELWPEADKQIHAKISDICISMKAKDWLKLKPRLDVVVKLELDDYQGYKQFEKEKVLELGDAEITALNAGALYNKLLQYCNGAVYDEDRISHVVNKTKLEALSEEIEALQGKPVLVFYQFKSDLERILKNISGSVKLTGTKEIDLWNKGKIPVLVAHAASTGHGLNLQAGGYNIIWFGLPWSLELYLQAVARIDRQGQTNSVLNKILITKGTVEEIVWKRLNKKEFTQDELILALKYYAKSVKNIAKYNANFLC